MDSHTNRGIWAAGASVLYTVFYNVFMKASFVSPCIYIYNVYIDIYIIWEYFSFCFVGYPVALLGCPPWSHTVITAGGDQSFASPAGTSLFLTLGKLRGHVGDSEG